MKFVTEELARVEKFHSEHRCTLEYGGETHEFERPTFHQTETLAMEILDYFDLERAKEQGFTSITATGYTSIADEPFPRSKQVNRIYNATGELSRVMACLVNLAKHLNDTPPTVAEVVKMRALGPNGGSQLYVKCMIAMNMQMELADLEAELEEAGVSKKKVTSPSSPSATPPPTRPPGTGSPKLKAVRSKKSES